MSMVKITSKGNFDKLEGFLRRGSRKINTSLLHEYGAKGVTALSATTPVDTGKTASSWRYEIENINGKTSLSFYNSNVNNGIPIAIIIDRGHATGNGGWVEGYHYIDPTIQPIFDSLANEIYKEVMS